MDPNYDTSFNANQFESTDVDLSQFDADFEQAEMPGGNYEPVPDGDYQVNVESVDLTNAKSSGAPMIKWKLRILGPSNGNRILWRNSVISDRSLQFLKKDLYTCGLQLNKLSELKNHLHKLPDVKLEITTKTNGDRQNIYFNRRIVTDDAPGYAASGDSQHLDHFDNNDDIPF